ncbi:osteocalcin 2-like [Pecten maximus]|uniref:osteocalcin 2-like n=1 Tax=Pecten maximus TaxID=6579 RepID=UPI001458C9F8|nr:osteocalcin 2-like [Pecten maximus]
MLNVQSNIRTAIRKITESPSSSTSSDRVVMYDNETESPSSSTSSDRWVNSGEETESPSSSTSSDRSVNSGEQTESPSSATSSDRSVNSGEETKSSSSSTSSERSVLSVEEAIFQPEDVVTRIREETPDPWGQPRTPPMAIFQPTDVVPRRQVPNDMNDNGPYPAIGNASRTFSLEETDPEGLHLVNRDQTMVIIFGI